MRTATPLERRKEFAGKPFFSPHEAAESSAATRPWTARMLMSRSREMIYEYACHEGNYGLVNMLAAARSEDTDK